MRQPLNDTKLIYDFNFHRYKLNYDSEIISRYVPNFYEVYGDNSDFEIDSQSNNVYTYLYSQTNSANKEYFEYLLACDETLRDIIFKMLIEQLRYDIQSGGNSVAYEHFLDKDARYDRMVCNNVKLIITNELHMSTGAFVGIYLPEDRYERWNY